MQAITPLLSSVGLADVVLGNEDWLIRRIIGYAGERGYTRHTSTLEESWRVSVSGLSSSLIQALKGSEGTGLEIGPDDDKEDPSTEFGILEAKKHRERGIPLRMFLGLMKYYRQGYKDLVRRAYVSPVDRDRNLRLVERFFDRVEIAFCVEWSGNPGHMLIAELQSKNRDLVDEKNLYRKIMETLPHPVFLLDSSTEIREMNLAGRALYRPDPGPGASRSLFSEEVDRFVESGEIRTFFEKTFTLEGETRQFQVHMNRVLDVSGKFTGVLMVLTDISIRARALQELADKHRELTRLIKQISFDKREMEGTLDCVRDMVIFTDRDQRIRRCNRPFQQFVGREFQDILGENLEDILREKDISIDLAGVEDTEVCQGKKERWFHIRRHPFICAPVKDVPPDTEDPCGDVVTLHDITDRMRIIEEIGVKNAELTDAYKELKRTQATIFQQEKMASIGQLAAGVAHEINNPMGFISSNLRTLYKYIERLTGFIDLQDSALKDAAGPLEPVRKARVDAKIDHIQGDIRALVLESIDGAERVRKIVQNLKSFSHVDQAEFMHADINECLNSAINIVWNEIKYKATLSRDLGEIPRTKCYPQQINQVLMNILINASHAIEKQGEIRVRSRVENDCACVSISDTGGGIPPGNMERLFEPFFTTKDVGKGTGLGLSIAYDIVKKHNGEILVESDIGKGSTFTVRIPLVEPM